MPQLEKAFEENTLNSRLDAIDKLLGEIVKDELRPVNKLDCQLTDWFILRLTEKLEKIGKNNISTTA